DNDGDMPILMADGIDNDGDGFIDQAPPATVEFEPRFEGIDEGRWSPLLPGMGDGRAPRFSQNLAPMGAMHPPGGYSPSPFNAVGWITPRVNLNPGPPASNPEFIEAANSPYSGTNLDPPDWKAFVERRWYPGDLVVVTLFQGPAVEGRVADRVTYSEFDV